MGCATHSPLSFKEGTLDEADAEYIRGDLLAHQHHDSQDQRVPALRVQTKP